MSSFLISCKAKNLEKAFAEIVLKSKKNLLVKVQ